ncbi:caffeine synthase 1 isoform X2 [Amborella trichopoda]|uniref:caffeine synthase 1 isoform X2 n=1 Tax=Amborella trichopoda TaxID=13333 RepID=UPI0009BECD58|nr:caffeine synthase 1 isoform X2 [Amborella trichopoda]|eukprot:XP_020523964.1 caffeine synthase 1 isoform X2 [Amborella trichopoda]
MDVEKTLHMKEGVGVTSYAQNSSLQKNGLDRVKPITEEAAINMLCSTNYPRSLVIADLGCASGPNTFSVLITIIKTICGRYREASLLLPEFQVYLNDLLGNDFNSVFRALPSFHESIGEKEGVFGSCFVAGVPGSFYGRLFPSNSLHFVHSSYSLHWLSRVPLGLYGEDGVPPNKGKIYISEASPPCVPKAYFSQFKKDFSLFLKSRSEEMIDGGRMVLMLLGRRTDNPCDKDATFLWEIFAKAFAYLVSKEKVDSYDVPFYAPSLKEVEEEVMREGSFQIEHVEVLNTHRKHNHCRKIVMAVRSINEPMLKQHFGEKINDNLFEKYGEILEKEMAQVETKEISFSIVLRKSH